LELPSQLALPDMGKPNTKRCTRMKARMTTLITSSWLSKIVIRVPRVCSTRLHAFIHFQPFKTSMWGKVL
jgi:hypothetical protein